MFPHVPRRVETFKGPQGGYQELLYNSITNVDVDENGIFRTSARETTGALAAFSCCNLHGRINAAFIVPELPWGLPRDATRKLPGRVFSRVWEILVALSSLYVGFSVPMVSLPPSPPQHTRTHALKHSRAHIP